jgi:hypothetical protein
MNEKKKNLESVEDQERFNFNIRQVEKTSLGFLELGCDFYDIYQLIQKNLEKEAKPTIRLDKKTRRKSIQKMLKMGPGKEDLPRKSHAFLKQDSLFNSRVPNPGEMSFMVDAEGRNSGFESISGMIDKSLEQEGLDTTIAFMSSDDEADEHEIHGFAQQINTEFLRKDLYEIFKDFNEIAVLLFSKTLKTCAKEYKVNPDKFKSDHFQSKNLNDDEEDFEFKPKTSEFSNRVLSESMHLHTEDFRRKSTIKPPGKETQLNLELAKMYRNKHDSGKDKWIEWVFWGFLASSIIIIIIFVALFYFNVIST